jgi:transcriptional regulator with XRE-family HTH domain
MATDQKLLTAVGEALYGARWQSDIARDLGVSDRTIRRWASGEDIPRPGVWRDLLALVLAHEKGLGVVKRALMARLSE